MISEPDIDASKILSDFADIGISMHDYSKPVYKYTSVETAKIILKTHKIRFRAPSTFNDPFEFSLDFFDRDLSNKEFKDRFEFLLRMQPGITSRRRKEILKNTSVADFKKSYDSTIERQRQLSMVFCTSEINNDILMWSHYANCHKGVCIGLFMPPVVSSIDFLTMKVNYTDIIKPKRFYTNDQHQRGLALVYWVFTKASCWSYEKEVRSVIKNEGNQLRISNEKFCDVELNSSQLKEIYFGLETSKKDVDDLTQIIKSKNYTIPIIKRMQKIKGTFEMQAV